ncbi:MAG TPA: PKD domain-containing protein, partial [Acidimicrobiia bacterium]|nr:PKD domain-containing protein [Acidimicrobiia bacterium]
ITHFDVQQYGAGDPEGIAYSPASGRLLVLDDNSSTVYELDISGTLINQIDISQSTGTRQAGVTLAPASSGPGDSLYIVDRRVDNGANSSENDGRMYEMTAPLAPAGNQPPFANAGPDQEVNFPDTATLDGTGSSDDGGIVSYAWSQIAGTPGAQFGDAAAASTTVTLPEAGTYTFQLLVTDGVGATDTDEVVVIAIGQGGPFTWIGAIAVGSDDAEELGTGGMRLANADLELVVKAGDVQKVGLRFANVGVPAGATVESAYVQFRSNGVSTGAVNLTIKAQNSVAPPTFVSQQFNITNRTTGNQAVTWNPPDWPVDNQTGEAQRTSDLKNVIQEVIGLPGWGTTGDDIVLIFTGSGTRVANAIEGGFASELHIVYSTGGEPPNQPPTASAGTDQQVGALSATLNGSGSDPENGALTYLWNQVGGPTATISNPNSASTGVTLPLFDTYTFELTVTDPGNLSDTDQVVVTAVDPSGPVQVEFPVAVGADDVEEKPTGRMVLGNGDLDMVLDGSTTMIVGLRFAGVTLPAGATITNAYIQFRADETQTAMDTNLSIRAHKVANAPAFTTTKFNLSGRLPNATSAVAWAPQAWTSGQSGLAQRTTNLATLINELQNAGWASGNAMVFIITGSGKRTADPLEGGFAPRLVIEYTTP